MSNIGYVKYKEQFTKQSDGSLATAHLCGILLQFTTDYEELNNGVGQYPAAIIQTPNGTLVVKPVTHCKMISEAEYRDFAMKAIRSQINAINGGGSDENKN